MTSLEIRDLGVKFESRQILSKLNLTIEAGAFAAILGPSGCGKTTLLRTIAGLITPSEGTIRFGKQLVSVSSLVLPPHKRNIGYVPQEGGLFPHLNVAENVGFALGKKISRDERQSIIESMLTLVGLSGFEKRLPQELSGGQQTRIALARALAMKPAMVLLDEPFAALDQALRAGISEEVVALPLSWSLMIEKMLWFLPMSSLLCALDRSFNLERLLRSISSQSLLTLLRALEML